MNICYKKRRLTLCLCCVFLSEPAGCWFFCIGKCVLYALLVLYQSVSCVSVNSGLRSGVNCFWISEVSCYVYMQRDSQQCILCFFMFLIVPLCPVWLCICVSYWRCAAHRLILGCCSHCISGAWQTWFSVLPVWLVYELL